MVGFGDDAFVNFGKCTLTDEIFFLILVLSVFEDFGHGEEIF